VQLMKGYLYRLSEGSNNSFKQLLQMLTSGEINTERSVSARLCSMVNSR